MAFPKDDGVRLRTSFADAAPPPCPVCDLGKIPGHSTLSALALGVGLGAAFGEPHGVTKLVCDAHRGAWVSAMCEASIYLNTPDEDADAPQRA